VCCSLLQCFAVFRSVLQCATVCHTSSCNSTSRSTRCVCVCVCVCVCLCVCVCVLAHYLAGDSMHTPVTHLKHIIRVHESHVCDMTRSFLPPHSPPTPITPPITIFFAGVAAGSVCSHRGAVCVCVCVCVCTGEQCQTHTHTHTHTQRTYTHTHCILLFTLTCCHNALPPPKKSQTSWA